MAVQHSSVKIEYPSNLDVRYKTYNIKGNVIANEANGIKTIYYAVNNLRPIEHEIASPELES